MKSILKYSILLLVMFACHRDKVDYLGPAYVSAPADFAVTNFTVTPASVNLATVTGKATFNATFSSTVSWILTIKGNQSGAVKKFTGLSNGLTNLTWNGVHDDLFFFRKGEDATATLSFYGNTLSPSVSFHIINVPNFKGFGGKGFFTNFGDFETPTQIVPTGHWHAFNVGGSTGDSIIVHNVTQGVDSAQIDYQGNKVPAVQGYYYYYIKGLGDQNNYVSGIQGGENGLDFSPQINTTTVPSDPTRVWVNVYLYGTGDPNALVYLEYNETDFDGTSPGFTPTDDDKWVSIVPLTHKGWKLFSFRYSDLSISTIIADGDNGNHIKEPNRLQFFDFTLVKKTNPKSPVEMYFDYPIITVDGPFVPKKP